MRIVYSETALRDPEEIFDYQQREWPQMTARFEARLSSIEQRLRAYPLSAQQVEGRSDVRTVPFIILPYRLFYRATPDAIEILHIHHAGREEPE